MTKAAWCSSVRRQAQWSAVQRPISEVGDTQSELDVMRRSFLSGSPSTTLSGRLPDSQSTLPVHSETDCVWPASATGWPACLRSSSAEGRIAAAVPGNVFAKHCVPRGLRSSLWAAWTCAAARSRCLRLAAAGKSPPASEAARPAHASSKRLLVSVRRPSANASYAVRAGVKRSTEGSRSSDAACLRGPAPPPRGDRVALIRRARGCVSLSTRDFLHRQLEEWPVPVV